MSGRSFKLPLVPRQLARGPKPQVFWDGTDLTPLECRVTSSGFQIKKTNKVEVESVNLLIAEPQASQESK